VGPEIKQDPISKITNIKRAAGVAQVIRLPTGKLKAMKPNHQKKKFLKL
jgi:hypothetical protein